METMDFKYGIHNKYGELAMEWWGFHSIPYIIQV